MLLLPAGHVHFGRLHTHGSRLTGAASVINGRTGGVISELAAREKVHEVIKMPQATFGAVISRAVALTGAQQTAGGRLGRGRRRRRGQALVAGDVGEEGGEVETRALAHRGQDGRRRVGRQQHHAVGQANRRAQVALVGGDAGVEGRLDEG